MRKTTPGLEALKVARANHKAARDALAKARGTAARAAAVEKEAEARKAYNAAHAARRVERLAEEAAAGATVRKPGAARIDVRPPEPRNHVQPAAAPHPGLAKAEAPEGARLRSITPEAPDRAVVVVSVPVSALLRLIRFLDETRGT